MAIPSSCSIANYIQISAQLNQVDLDVSNIPSPCWDANAIQMSYSIYEDVSNNLIDGYPKHHLSNQDHFRQKKKIRYYNLL